MKNIPANWFSSKSSYKRNLRKKLYDKMSEDIKSAEIECQL